LIEDEEEWPVEFEILETTFLKDMLGFFEELSDEAEGWTGMKEWESEFAEVRIVATNGGEGTASLVILMRRPPGYDEQRRATLEIRTDDLPKTAEHMRAFLRLPQGERFRSAPAES